MHAPTIRAIVYATIQNEIAPEMERTLYDVGLRLYEPVDTGVRLVGQISLLGVDEDVGAMFRVGQIYAITFMQEGEQ